MTGLEKTKRYVFFLLGLFISSFGVSLVTKSNLGTSPISSIPYTLSLGFAPTIGTFTMVFSVVLIILQLIILKKDFPKEYWLQIPVSILFSYFIDLTMNMLYFLQPEVYILKLIYLILGCVILALGVFIEVIANVVMLPGECFVKAISDTYGKDFGKTKIAFDSTMSIMAMIMGIVLFHKLSGVREGTIVAAFLVGMVVKIFKNKFSFIEEILIDYKNIERQNLIS